MGKVHKHTEEVEARLSKIEGHVRSIRKMMEEGRSCDQVLIQMHAVSAAIKKAVRILLEDHYTHCVIGKNRDKKLETALTEFRKVLGGFVD